MKHILRFAWLSVAMLVACAFVLPLEAGVLLVSYNNNTVHQFDSVTGADLGTFAGSGLSAPAGIGYDAITTTVYVANYGSGTVRKFAGDGTDLGVFASGLSGASGVAVDHAGNVYVANYTGGSVSKFSSAGALLHTFNTGAYYPDGVAIDATTGTLLVNYYTGGPGEIHRFGLDGADLGTVASGLTNPLPITLDAAGNIYIYEWTTSTLKKFSSAGTPLGSATIPQSYGLVINEMGELLSGDVFGNSIGKYNLSLGSLGSFASTGAQAPSYMTLVPEPARAVFLMMAMCALGLQRRRAGTVRAGAR